MPEDETTEITSSIETITPADAERMLGRNNRNRTLKRPQVEKWKQDIVAGKWVVANDDICFDVDDNLLNGQHRLHAVLETGIAIRCGVKRGLAPSTFEVMDSGAARTLGDVLSTKGKSLANNLAATTRLLLLVTTGRIYTAGAGYKVSHAEALQFFEANEEIIETGTQLGVRYGRARAILSPLGPLCTFAVLAYKACGEWEVVEEFLAAMASRANLKPDSAILAADNRLRMAALNKQNFESRNHLYLLIKTWNYWSQGQPARKLSMAPKGEFTLPPIAVHTPDRG